MNQGDRTTKSLQTFMQANELIEDYNKRGKRISFLEDESAYHYEEEKRLRGVIELQEVQIKQLKEKEELSKKLKKYEETIESIQTNSNALLKNSVFTLDEKVDMVKQLATNFKVVEENIIETLKSEKEGTADYKAAIAMRETAKNREIILLEKAHKMQIAINKSEEKGATFAQKYAKKRQEDAERQKKIDERTLAYNKELEDIARDFSKHKNMKLAEEAMKTARNKYDEDIAETGGKNKYTIGEKIFGILSNENGLGGTLKSINKNIVSFGSKIEGSINSGVDAYSNYLGKVDSRLQSSTGILNGGFKSIVKNMTMTYGSSPFVKQAEYLSKLVELVDKGVTSNLEERATIMALGDNLLNSFNATSQSLLRLVRIQGTDLTASSLGSQALLTKFLNTNYGDSSYISDMYQNVDDILLDAAALMSPDEATSFRYEVQKWLGSLYSRGASGQAITSLAQGLVALSTGNNAQLSSNQGLRTLLLSSATSAGLDYGSLMHSGLDSSTVGLLMNALISNVGDIYSNASSSRILGTSYGNVYGLNLADIRAISNLNPASILNSSTTNYQTSYNEYLNQVGQLGNRSTASTRARNFLDNLVYTGGLNIAGEDTDYWIYTIVDMLSNTLSGDAKGYAELGKMGMLLGSSVSLTPSTIYEALTNGDWAGLLSGTVTAGKNWGAVIDPTGYAFSLPGASNTTGISGSISVGNAGESRFLNLQDNALAVSATTQNVLGSKNVVARDINDLYAALFEEQSTPIRVKLATIEKEAIDMLTSGDGLLVDINNTDVGSINDAISNLKLVRNDFYYYGDQSR